MDCSCCLLHVSPHSPNSHSSIWFDQDGNQEFVLSRIVFSPDLVVCDEMPLSCTFVGCWDQQWRNVRNEGVLTQSSSLVLKDPFVHVI